MHIVFVVRIIAGTLPMWIKTILLSLVLGLSNPAFAAPEPDARSPLAGIEWRDVEKILHRHFSLDDIANLKDYLKSALLGLPTPMPSDLKAKVRDFIAEMRLEYGFQFAVMIEQLKKKLFRVLPPDLAELAEEFSKKPQADLEE
jgi:hypothetical protein